MTGTCSYSCGDPVYIWSTTQESWLETTVEKIRPCGKIDTKIKSGCPEKYVRRTDDPLISSSRVVSSDSQPSLLGQIVTESSCQDDEASSFLAVVDEEVDRILGLHAFPHVALLLDLLEKSPEDVAEFFASCDMRSARLQADLLNHLGKKTR